MKKIPVIHSLLLSLALSLLAGCGGSSSEPAPLSADNLNLIFVVSPDLAHNASGDVNKDTANLSNQGLQRSLLMATYLKQQVLGTQNVTAIHALTPMTHLQTANNYPDMAALGYIQQFALLNQITLGTNTANSYPLNAAYVSGAVPDGVAMQPKIFPNSPSGYCPDCSGLVFNDTKGDNAALVSGIINKPNASGYYVFSAPWQTISALMANINESQSYKLNLPAAYRGPNHVYAISIAPSGDAKLVTYDSKLTPLTTYPELPSHQPFSASCTNTQQALFSTARTGGVDGATVPTNSSFNQIIYIVRHAEAHPDPAMSFENGNFVGAGQWRALDLHNALDGKIKPDMVYSVDPAQWYPISATKNVSYVRPSLTVLPYAIANNLPYSLASSFSILDPNHSQLTSDFFFTGGKFSNKTVLVAWESSRIKPLINALLASYGGANIPVLPTEGPPKGGWPSPDYDTIWTVKLDATGNLTVDNKLCEGIDTTKLPVAAPQF